MKVLYAKPNAGQKQGDATGHGSRMSSLVMGRRCGVARKANVVIVKLDAEFSQRVAALNSELVILGR